MVVTYGCESTSQVQIHSFFFKSSLNISNKLAYYSPVIVRHFWSSSMWIIPHAFQNPLAMSLLGDKLTLVFFGAESAKETRCFLYCLCSVCCGESIALLYPSAHAELEPLSDMICLWLSRPHAPVGQHNVVGFSVTAPSLGRSELSASLVFVGPLWNSVKDFLTFSKYCAEREKSKIHWLVDASS